MSIISKKQKTLDHCLPFYVAVSTPTQNGKAAGTPAPHAPHSPDSDVTLSPNQLPSWPCCKTEAIPGTAAITPSCARKKDTTRKDKPQPGDLVEMMHPKKKFYSLFGIVESYVGASAEGEVIQMRVSELQKISVLWHNKTMDGELEVVTVPKKFCCQKRGCDCVGKKE